MLEPQNFAEWVGIIGGLLMLCVIVGIACWPLIKVGLDEVAKRRHKLAFWTGVAIMTVYGGTKPPEPSVEGIAMKIDRVWSNKVQCSWQFEGEPELEGKRVTVRVHNDKMNGWLTVFEGDAETDRSCTFAGCYIVDDTEVQIMVENAVMVANISLEVAR